VLRRPLALAFVLCTGDYLLWEWSLGNSHDTVALISGLTLPPIAVVFAGLLVLNVARLLADTARRPASRSATRRDPARNHARRSGQREHQPTDSSDESWKDERVSSSASSKLAA
jgi:hypothetical protein